MNSFGYGGTNAHVIIDDAFHYAQSWGLKIKHNVQLPSSTNGLLTPPEEPCETSTDMSGSITEDLVFLLSAADENGIGRQASALATHLERSNECHGAKYLQDLAFTLSQARAKLPWKSYVLAASTSALRNSLLQWDHKPVRTTESPTMQFVFTGQGAQWASMGMELLCYPVFEATVKYADAYFRSIGSTWSVLGK